MALVGRAIAEWVVVVVIVKLLLVMVVVVVAMVVVLVVVGGGGLMVVVGSLMLVGGGLDGGGDSGGGGLGGGGGGGGLDGGGGELDVGGGGGLMVVVIVVVGGLVVVVTVVLGVLLMGWHVVVVHHARGIVQTLWPALMLHVVVRGHGVPAHVLVLPIVIGPWSIVMGLSSIDTEALQRWSWAAGCRSQSRTRRTAAWPLQSPPLVCGRTGTGPCARTARRRSPASATPAKTHRRAGGGIGDGRWGWFAGPRGVGQRLQAWPPQSAGKESSLPLHRQSMLCVGC